MWTRCGACRRGNGRTQARRAWEGRSGGPAQLPCGRRAGTRAVSRLACSPSRRLSVHHIRQHGITLTRRRRTGGSPATTRPLPRPPMRRASPSRSPAPPRSSATAPCRSRSAAPALRTVTGASAHRLIQCPTTVMNTEVHRLFLIESVPAERTESSACWSSTVRRSWPSLEFPVASDPEQVVRIFHIVLHTTIRIPIGFGTMMWGGNGTTFWFNTHCVEWYKLTFIKTF